MFKINDKELVNISKDISCIHGGVDDVSMKLLAFYINGYDEHCKETGIEFYTTIDISEFNKFKLGEETDFNYYLDADDILIFDNGAHHFINIDNLSSKIVRINYSLYKLRLDIENDDLSCVVEFEFDLIKDISD